MLELQPYPGRLTLSILKANPANPALTERVTYRPAIPPQGFALALQPIVAKEIRSPASVATLSAATGWECGKCTRYLLEYPDEDNRVSIAVKQISQDGSSRIVVHNRFGT